MSIFRSKSLSKSQSLWCKVKPQSNIRGRVFSPSPKLYNYRLGGVLLTNSLVVNYVRPSHSVHTLQTKPLKEKSIYLKQLHSFPISNNNHLNHTGINFTNKLLQEVRLL